MSMETELKKIAVNLQQLTDAVTTLTAVMEIHKPVVIPAADDSVKAEPIPMGDVADGLITGAGTIANVVEETITNTVVDIHAGAQETSEIMTMEQANVELQRIVGELGEGGGNKVRTLLKEHNAITLAQIPADGYGAFVEAAQQLIAAKTA